MNSVIASITLRQLLSRRRTILLLLLGAVMLLVALALRFGAEGANLARYTSVLLETFGIATLMRAAPLDMSLTHQALGTVVLLAATRLLWTARKQA